VAHGNWQQDFALTQLGQLCLTHALLQSSLHAAQALLERQTFSNPHSRNPSSLAAEREIIRARQQVLQFFNADPEEYTVVWTR
jgi:selenocysteine lyase/cysteine desulfurase